MHSISQAKTNIIIGFCSIKSPTKYDIFGETTQNVSTIYRCIYTMQLKCKWLNERLGEPEHVDNSNF